MGLQEGLDVTRAKVGDGIISYRAITGNIRDIHIDNIPRNVYRNTLRRACVLAFNDDSLSWKYVKNEEMREALISGTIPESAKNNDSRMATENQKEAIRKHNDLGLSEEEISNLTFTEASKMIAEGKARKGKTQYPKPDPDLERLLREEEEIERRTRGNRPHNPDASVDLSELKKGIADLTEAITINQVKTDRAIQNVASEVQWLAERVTAIENDMESIRKLQPKITQITFPNREVIQLDEMTHEILPRVLKHLIGGNKVMLVGPAGSGKTTIAEHCAKALGVSFDGESCCWDKGSTLIDGFKNITTGEYVRTRYRDCYEGYGRHANGALFLLDELDAADPGTTTAMNMSIDNGHHAFPDGMIERQKVWYLIAGANTYGTGPDALYVGRNQLDAATLNRFVKVYMDYDRNLEYRLAHMMWDDPQTDKWIEYVYKLRDNQQRHQINAIFGTRQIIQGVNGLRTGLTWEECVDDVLRGGITRNTWDQLNGGF